MDSQSLYSVYDRKAGLYLPPFSAAHDTAAVRMFIETVMTSETPVSQYPADFDLMRHGTFDPRAGAIQLEMHPVPLMNGLVALQDAQATRSRYQAILQPQPSAEEPSQAS